MALVMEVKVYIQRLFLNIEKGRYFYLFFFRIKNQEEGDFSGILSKKCNLRFSEKLRIY